MSSPSSCQFSIASAEEDFAAIHRLNYRTFVEEIPQHDPNPDGLLVDRFHGQNVYLICRIRGALAGMLALRFVHPFSLEEKLGDLSGWLPPGRGWCEIRLLAVDPQWRGSAVMGGLLRFAAEEVVRRGRDAAVVSATTRQRKLYGHLGFTPFARLVGREGAWYQPMYLLVEDFHRHASALTAGTRPARRPDLPVNLLPGPVTVRDEVRHAFAREAVSHRGEPFLTEWAEARRQLCALTGMPHASLLAGSGTLANDAIAARLAVSGEPGLVISCGEFGDRLLDHARRWGLEVVPLRLPDDTAPDLSVIADALARHPRVRWVWTTHCETSTGALTPVPALVRLAGEAGCRVCLDSVSTAGVVPLDLSGVWMASCSSGKGLAAIAGVAVVLHADLPRPEARLPRYLDLGLYQGEAPPFTQTSALVSALHAALTQTDWPGKHCRVRGMGDDLRRRLTDAGLTVIGGAEDPAFSPAVITLALPPSVASSAFALRMESRGWLLSAHSGYLQRRNHVQVCLMGDVLPGAVVPLPDECARVLHECRTAGA